MVVLRLSVLREWSVWMSLLLEWGLCVDHVPLGTVVTLSSVMVSKLLKACHVFELLFFISVVRH